MICKNWNGHNSYTSKSSRYMYMRNFEICSLVDNAGSYKTLDIRRNFVVCETFIGLLFSQHCLCILSSRSVMLYSLCSLL